MAVLKEKKMDIHGTSTIYVSETRGEWFYSGFTANVDEIGNGPVKNFSQAFEKITEIREAGDFRPITIKLTEDCYLDAPIEIDFSKKYHRITPSYLRNIVITSDGDRKNVYGGKPVTGWKRDSFNGVSCFSASIEKNKDGEYPYFTDFYVSGKKADMTRYPTDGSTLRAIKTENDFPDGGYYLHSGWFIADGNDLRNLKGINNAFISFFHYWVDEHTPIRSYDEETGKIEFKYKSRMTITSDYSKNHPSEFHYYFENVPEAFHNPNEWYYDRENGRVYYIPESENVSPEEIVAVMPLTDRLFDFKGLPTEKITNIRIENLGLFFTETEYRSSRSVDGCCDSEIYASDGQSVNNGFGAVNFFDAERCSVVNCEIACAGIYALVAEEGCKNVVFTDNVIRDVSAGGIKVKGGSYGCESEKETSFIKLYNNKIYNLGRRYACGCGILVIDAHDCEILENEVHDVYYTGISVGWSWGYDKSNTYGNLIKGNHIYRIGYGLLSDMGGIYTLGIQEGTVIENNLIHDVESYHYGGWGIYLDEGSSYILVKNNIVYNTKCESFHMHYGKNNVVRENVFAFGKSGLVRITLPELHDGVLFESNIMLQKGLPIFSDNYDLTTIQFLHFSDNVFYDYSGEMPFAVLHGGKEESVIELLEKLGKNNGNEVRKPEMTDPLNFDFGKK